MFHFPFKLKKQKAPEEKPISPIRVVIMGRDDNATVSLKHILAQSFESMPFLSVVFEDDFTIEDFLNPDNKNFFDFFDTGIKALKKNHADVLLRFYQNGAQIRFNFLTQNMYSVSTPPFFSSLFAIYLPVSYFQNQNLPTQISCLISATFIALSLQKDARHAQTLKGLMDILSKNKMPQGIEKRFMPHILSLLAFNYLALHTNSFHKKDMLLISNLINSANKIQEKPYDSLIEGELLTLSGQMYACAADAKNADSYTFFEHAIEKTKKALKYFSKYIFPYDYARLCIVLSKFYFSFFKLSENRQSLRDAVFYMREAEKIFTRASVPNLWADIQGDLGAYLAHLSFYSKNKEIAELAVESYRNKQSFYQQETHPLFWAQTEKNIADIYYYLGKDLENTAYLEKATDTYLNALDVFEELGDTTHIQMIENALKKADDKFLSSNKK